MFWRKKPGPRWLGARALTSSEVVTRQGQCLDGWPGLNARFRVTTPARLSSLDTENLSHGSLLSFRRDVKSRSLLPGVTQPPWPPTDISKSPAGGVPRPRWPREKGTRTPCPGDARRIWGPLSSHTTPYPQWALGACFPTPSSCMEAKCPCQETFPPQSL